VQSLQGGLVVEARVVEASHAACGNDIPVLIYKFNNKQSRVCIPLYAINPALPKDNGLTAVMTFDDWLVIMRKNWDHYELLTEA
jgi:hypothetical protein